MSSVHARGAAAVALVATRDHLPPAQVRAAVVSWTVAVGVTPSASFFRAAAAQLVRPGAVRRSTAAGAADVAEAVRRLGELEAAAARSPSSSSWRDLLDPAAGETGGATVVDIRRAARRHAG